jgi:hypothetical protein
VTNVREVYRRTSRALHQRREGYQSLFKSVERHVSEKFMSYMMRRKYQGKLRIKEEEGELRLLVKMSEDGDKVRRGGAGT